VLANGKEVKVKSRFEEMEDILKVWFEILDHLTLPVSGVILWDKAMHTNKGLQIDDFSASSGWIDRFKQRHNLVYKGVCVW
jgi:hypothetical protein